MSTSPFSNRGQAPESSGEPDTWSQSLMGRTEEMAHLQAQQAPADVPRDASPASHLEGGVTPRRRNIPTPPPPPPPSALAAALRLGGAACGLLAAGLLALPALRHAGEPPPTREELAAARPETTLAPQFDTPAEVPEGEVREQHAFMEGVSVLMVDTVPPGATLSVNGRKEGTTPLSVTLDCLAGAPVTVKLTRRGFSPLEHTLTCRQDTMTQLSGRLRKGKGGAKP
ncbi:PEGA domain-containing protein [Myxococcus sp. Y35]|uniref:PEGA domain-containing protein n=1 Tax=Pseudomyxococcus flavus TaxID=3115648 RepID=UPI003CF5C73D